MKDYIIADNQELTRYALEHLISEDKKQSVFYAWNRASLVNLLAEHPDAIVLLDYTLFDFSDEDQLLIVAERFNQSQWILLSDELTPQFMRRVVYSSHQFSVLFKDGPLSEVRVALQSVGQSKTRFLSQRVMEVILNQQREEETQQSILTETEKEIVKAIAQGKTTKEIANERFSSIHTITTHRKNIFRKLNVNTIHEVVKYALRAGLIDSSEFYI